MSDLCFVNPFGEILQSENRLPHWQQPGKVYFLTYRLADAIPGNPRREWHDERAAWLRFHPEPWTEAVEAEYHKRFSGALERWLDAGHGQCLLRRAEVADIVTETFRHFDGTRFGMISFVVMPNHVHALFVQDRRGPSTRPFTAGRSLRHGG